MTIGSSVASAESTESLRVENISDSGVVIQSSRRDGTYLIESSTDLLSFDASSLVYLPNAGSLGSSWAPRAQSSRQFFRLFGPLESDLDFELLVNTSSHSSYLGSLRYVGKMEIHFFGTRDNSGLPAQIDYASAKFGIHQSLNVSRVALPASSSSSFISRTDNDVDLSGVAVVSKKGLVVVARSSANWPAPSTPPKIQVVAQDLINGTTTYDLPTRYLESHGANDVYEYEVVLGAVAGDHLDNEEAFREALVDFGACFIPASNVPTPDDIFWAGVCGTLAYPKQTKIWPPAFASTTLSDIFSGKIRASIPVDGNYNIHASPWVDLYTPIGDLIYTSFDDLPTLIIDIPRPPQRQLTISRRYSISDGFNNSARVKLLDFDFSTQLGGISAPFIERVEWTIAHRISGADVTLQSTHPSGANGHVNLIRSLNGLSSLTPGLVIPRNPANAYSGLFLLNSTQVFQFIHSQSPYKLSFPGEINVQEIVETSPDRLGAYLNPFTIEVIASQHAETQSRVFGLPAPSFEQTNAKFDGMVTVKLFIR